MIWRRAVTLTEQLQSLVEPFDPSHVILGMPSTGGQDAESHLKWLMGAELPGSLVKSLDLRSVE